MSSTSKWKVCVISPPCKEPGSKDWFFYFFVLSLFGGLWHPTTEVSFGLSSTGNLVTQGTDEWSRFSWSHRRRVFWPTSHYAFPGSGRGPLGFVDTDGAKIHSSEGSYPSSSGLHDECWDVQGLSLGQCRRFLRSTLPVVYHGTGSLVVPGVPPDLYRSPLRLWGRRRDDTSLFQCKKRPNHLFALRRTMTGTQTLLKLLRTGGGLKEKQETKVVVREGGPEFTRGPLLH